ncbi:hypothetical protein LUZ60_000171 [Juncus effusus]|nr:hypothetical protein LUZ60_000171 [Juncus effusus]
MASSTLPHIAILPFMSKGHTIPLLHLSHLLLRRNLVSHITIFTTPLNSPFIHSSLSPSITDKITIVSLPFPHSTSSEIPPNVESTDQLSSPSLFLPFVTTIVGLKSDFSKALGDLSPPPSLLISDGFLGWAVYAASDHNVPCITFYGMGGFAQAMSAAVSVHKPHAGISSPYEPFAVPGFPQLFLTKSDLEPPFDDPNPKGPHYDWVAEQIIAVQRSRGFIFNSFYELESVYFDNMSRELCTNYIVGPFCLARLNIEKTNRTPSRIMEWLDLRLNMNRPVLYIAFGTQVKLSAAQMKEIMVGLEQSKLDFVWVVRGQDSELDDGFKERVKNQGIIVNEWMDQMEILSHKCIHGFITHCGWNSILESICFGVPVLSWPMIAEQRLNAKFVVEELKMGFRLRASDGTKEGLVKADDIEKLARELVLGEDGKIAKKNAEELAVKARRAMDDGGLSYNTLEKMIKEICGEIMV